MSLEIDYKKLKTFGIANDGKKKQFCPECHANRTDKRDKSLSVDWEKCIAHCHYCGKNFFFGKTERIGNYQQPKALSTMKEKTYHKPAKLANETMPDEKVLAWFASRGIPAEVVMAVKSVMSNNNRDPMKLAISVNGGAYNVHNNGDILDVDTWGTY